MPDTRPSPIFIADALALDFLNSIAVPVATQIEWLASGEDLLAWLNQAGLVPDDVSDSLRKSAVPGELDAIAAQARALREWFRVFIYEHKGRPLQPNVLPRLEPLNRVLARDEEFGQIVARDHEHHAGLGFIWRSQRRWRSPDSLLLPIARAMTDLICADNFTYVKACEGPSCTLLFIDRTKGHARRWCSMAVCGNRAKQTAHRKRAEQAQAAAEISQTRLSK